MFDYCALAKLLLASNPEPASYADDVVEELMPLIEKIFKHVQEALPNLEVIPEAFITHIGERLSWSDGPAAALQELHGADLFLAFAASEGEPLARNHFMELYHHIMVRAQPSSVLMWLCVCRALCINLF